MRVLIIVVLMFQIATVLRGEAADAFLGLPFPKDVSFGMSPTEIQKARPTVRIKDNSGKTGLFGAAEVVTQEENGVITGYIYHFKQGKLGAITYNRALTNMLSDAETKRLYMKLLSSGYAPDTLQTARAGQVITVKRWKDAKAKVEICLEATTRGTTITFLSPAIIAVEDLFPNVAEKSRQDAILGKRQSSSANSGKEENRSIDRLSSNAPPHCALGGIGASTE